MDLSENGSIDKMPTKKTETRELKCTCPQYNFKRQKIIDVTAFENVNTEQNISQTKPKVDKRSYNRSISLGHIIQFPVCEPDSSFQSKQTSSKREMTDFEKYNLLFLKELKAKRREQHQFIEKQVNELPYLPFPRRKRITRYRNGHRNMILKEDFPLTAFHPSKMSSSEILRSISLEETESESNSSSEDPKATEVQVKNGFQNKSHEGNWKRIEEFLQQSGFSRNHGVKTNSSVQPFKPNLPSKNMHTLTSVSFPAKSGQYFVDELLPSEKNDCPSSIHTDSDYLPCKNERQTSKQDDFINFQNVQQWLTNSSADTTQRPVHDAKNSKTEESRISADNSTSGTSSVPNVSGKPPRSVYQTTSVSQSPSEYQTPPETEGSKMGSAMAFTVDFGDSGTSDSSGSAGANKRLEISGPLSQFAPKPKRNLSLNKVEENKKVEERKIEKPPVGRPRSNTAGISAVGTRKGGYHSEGYFSSDQEDEAARKAVSELKSPRSPKSAGALSINRSSSGETQKSNILRKSYGRPEGRTCCKERKPSVPELNSRLNRSQEKISSPKCDAESSRRNSKSSPTFSDPSKDDKDDVSDTGTYTIDKDSPEVEAARNDISRVFGAITESNAELTTSAAVHNTSPSHVLDDESWLSPSENQKAKVAKVISRNSPNWIQQWAESVAEQTKPAMKTIPCPPRAQQVNVTPHSSLQDNLDVRPRRKLPTPPQYPSPRSYPKENIYDDDQQGTPKTKPKSSKSFRNYFESQESGGDSDLDFRSYSFTDDERLTASLREKLRMTGLNASSPKNLPSPRTSPKRFDMLKATPQNDMIEDTFCGKLNEQSDSSSETSGQYKEPSRISESIPPLKFNRAFSLRRARLACDDDVAKQVIEKKKAPSSRPSSAGNGRKAQLGGTRAYQSVDSSSSAVKSPLKNNIKREPTSKKGSRSNSSLSPKEVEFQNWKRRKNYDPMKAAAEGRKKQMDKIGAKSSDQNDLTSDSPSPHNSLLRSASFHGTNGAAMETRWGHKLSNHLQYTSEEDGPLSLEEEVPRRVTSPLHRSPTSPNHIYSPALRHHYSQGASKSFPTPMAHHEQNITPHFQVSQRKISTEEAGSEGKRSPLNSQAGSRANRPKTKMEALDNLVISTIHSLSVKVRTTAESLLLKLKSQYDEEGERAVLLQEVLSHLTESDQSLSSQSRSTSRELAGILRNLKKIEHALQVVDKVMVTGESLDDDDGEEIPNDWEESDY